MSWVYQFGNLAYINKGAGYTVHDAANVLRSKLLSHSYSLGIEMV